MNVKEIVKEYLEKNGFDGLYIKDQCSCKNDDLMSCSDEGIPDCEPGYIWDCDKCEYDNDCDLDHKGKCVGDKQ